MIRTDDEISAEITLLKAMMADGRIHRRTFFGDNNHDRVFAQIKVLTDRMTESQIHDHWPIVSDDPDDPDADWDDSDLLEFALDAYNWMTVPDTDAPSSGWN